MSIARRVPDELPPPVTAALPPEAPELMALGEQRLALLRQAAGAEPVLAVARTRTITDTGSWFGRRRVFVAFTPTALLIFAKGPRPLCCRTPLAELGKTRYNVVTGELCFAPAELPVRRVALPPVVAARALAQIGRN